MSMVKLVNLAGTEQESLDLGIAMPEAALNPKNYACAIRVLLQNWRQGTVACKTRGQVAFSNKKPWRQKGTGRARAGTPRSPLWRKGGVVFGPQARVRTLTINRKQRRLGLQNLFSLMIEGGAVYCVDHDFSVGQSLPKTKDAARILKGIGSDNKKGVLFLPHEDTLNFAAFRNISAIGILSFDQPNIFDLSSIDYWMFLKRDVELFKNMVEKWI